MTKAGLTQTKPSINGQPKHVYVPLETGMTSRPIAMTSRVSGRRAGFLTGLCIALLLIAAMMLGWSTGRMVFAEEPCAGAQPAYAAEVEEALSSSAAPPEAPVPPHEVYRRDAHINKHAKRNLIGETKTHEKPHSHKSVPRRPTFDAGKPIVMDADPKAQNESFSFEDIFDPDLRPRGVDTTWMSGDVFTYRDNDNGNVYSWDAATGDKTLLLANTTLESLGTGTYFVSPDMQYVLIAYNRQQVWRHSWTATYVIHDVNAPEDDSLIMFPNDDALEGETLQYARWGSSGNSLSFVSGNNLYYQAGVNEEAQQVTTSGSQPYIFNGMPDWMYEEDVVGSSVGHFFSDDDAYLVYVKYNDTGVPLQSWPEYGAKEDVYGDVISIAYPKAGDTNDGKLGGLTQVTLYVLSTSDVTTQLVLQPPAKFASDDHYYTRVAWSDDNRVFVAWTNRAQNETVYMMYNPDTAEGVQNLEFEVNGGWIDSPATKPWFIPGESSYWTILSEPIGDDSWPHVALVTAPDNAEGTITYVASGEMAVASIAGYDPTNHYVYYISTNFDPTERHIYRAGTQDAAEPEPVCLTCNFPDTCRYIGASFSETGSYYVESCSGPDVPSYRLKGVDNVTNEVLEDNADVRARLSVKQLPSRDFIEFPVTDGYMARADVYYPYNFDITKTYKILLYPYAGPNSQKVYKTFPIGSNTNNWLMYMKSTEHNTVVASVDARGTTMRSDNFRFLMYRKLGFVEIEDQLAAGRYFRSQSYFDNDDKLAIFGWSYGGFVTAKTLANSGEEEFQCGISIAPVSCKRYYDSAYTERYLAFDLPTDNEAGYNNTDIMADAALFHGKDFLLGHGTADDNVHFMHTTQLANALIQEEFQYRQLIYPDENHNIAGDKAARHLYRALTNFLTDDCWEQ